MSSPFGETFLFLTKLAWNCRVSLPMLVTIVFMAMDFRMQVEINVHTERIVFEDDMERITENTDASDSDSSMSEIFDDDEEEETDDDEEDLESGRDNQPFGVAVNGRFIEI